MANNSKKGLVLGIMREGINVLREETGNSEMNAILALTFLEIASTGETGMQDLQKRLGVSIGAVSRNVARLGVGEKITDKGPLLVETFEDPANRKFKIVRLTARGRKVVERLEVEAGRFIR